MLIKTRDFGEMDIHEEDIVTFESAIFGFEDYRRFVFLYEEEISAHFVWLQSVDEPDLCFILVDPALVAYHYAPQVPESIVAALGEGEYMSWLIVVIKEEFTRSTVNLKSPILVNPETKRGAQVILEEDYPIHHPLLAEKEGA